MNEIAHYEQNVMDKKIYHCIDCGKLRSKDEGGTVFTVCDECWEKRYPKEIPND